MEISTKDYDVGVIIGRFQLHKLHEAHKELVNHVLDRHKKVIVMLGVSPAIGTQRNPLDFLTRKLMLEETFGHQISAIIPIHDQKSNEVWSKQVDTKIREIVPMGSVVIYGSRDSFISSYSGGFDTLELKPNSYVSATSIRNDTSKEVVKSSDFRAGVIYSVFNNYPTTYPTVDVAILNENGEVLLGRKPNETEWRFIGGFVDPSDQTLEAAAKREAAEETGLELECFKYICSRKVQDWRYRNEPARGIMTTLFQCKHIFGSPQPNDDICELKWFPLFDEHLPNRIVQEHIHLLNTLKEKNEK